MAKLGCIIIIKIRRERFQSFEMTIISEGKKLSGAVHSSSAQLQYGNCVSIIFDVAKKTRNFLYVWPKINFKCFDIILHFFPVIFIKLQIHQIHFMSIMALACVNFHYIFSSKNSDVQDGGCKLTCHLTSYATKLYGIAEEAQGYVINVNSFRYENLEEWFHKPIPPPPPPQLAPLLIVFFSLL